MHSKLMCVDRQKFFIGSANFHRMGMKKLSELNVLIKQGDQLRQKWEQWRREHLTECQLISKQSRLNYNRLLALTEAVVC
jgi:cardiolipin synthase